MVDKRTTLGLLESTLYNFNCAKVENKFNSADDLLLFLLELFIKEKELRNKPIGRPMETDRFIKEDFVIN